MGRTGCFEAGVAVSQLHRDLWTRIAPEEGNIHGGLSLGFLLLLSLLRGQLVSHTLPFGFCKARCLGLTGDLCLPDRLSFPGQFSLASYFSLLCCFGLTGCFGLFT